MAAVRSVLAGGAVGGWRRRVAGGLVGCVLASLLVVLPAEVVSATADDDFAAEVLAHPKLLNFWKLDGSPAVNGTFPDSAPSGTGAPYPLRRNSADSTVGVSGAVPGGSAVQLGSVAARNKLGAEGAGVRSSVTTASVAMWVKPDALPASGKRAVLFDVNDYYSTFGTAA